MRKATLRIASEGTYDHDTDAEITGTPLQDKFDKDVSCQAEGYVHSKKNK